MTVRYGLAMGPSDGLVGANVIGFFDAENGLGEVARGLVACMDAAGIGWSVATDREASARQEAHFNRTEADSRYPATIICANAAEFDSVFLRHRNALRSQYRIAVWAWETDTFPKWMARTSDLVDEIWTLSRHAADAISRTTSKPVYVFAPPSIRGDETLRPPAAESRAGYTFFFSFDFLSIVERKNPKAAILAFERAFRPEEGARLVIKSVNGNLYPEKLRALQQAAAHRDDIEIIDGYVSQSEQFALMSRCDAYVSLHRAEGYGLTIAEAMAAGRPVLATAYSGNVDFMTAENSCLVPFELVSVPPGCWPYVPGSRWAEPDVNRASELMRKLYDDPAWARSIGERARSDMTEFHSPAARGPFLTQRLEQACRAGGRRRPLPLRLQLPVRRARRIASRLRSRVSPS